VVITYLDIKRVAIEPTETNPPLIIYADRILPRSISLELFKAIACRNPHVVEPMCGIQARQFTPGADYNIRWKPANPFTPEELFCSLVLE